MRDHHGSLTAYRAKRHFDRTHEPRGARAPDDADPVFVVQIHQARTTHFDFRLEADGVLRSWSVPKGPSTDVHDRRLAMPTEDHPMEYREFEGVIAAGEYGAGAVIIWDEGVYEPLAGSTTDRGRTFAEALDHGHATFRLHGTKVRGAYALTRFRGGPESGEREAWLLVKKKERRAAGRDAPDPVRARSARSGRTLRQVAADEQKLAEQQQAGGEWESGDGQDAQEPGGGLGGKDVGGGG